jgi:periplasmic protein CpxP/Spy
MKQVLLCLPVALILATAPMLPSIAEVTMVAQRPDDRLGAQLEQLNLTASQKDKITQIRTASRKEIQALLTPEQRQKWQLARQNRQRPEASPEVNLSDDQKAKIRSVRQNTRRQIEAVLTPEQLQKWEQIRPARQ